MNNIPLYMAAGFNAIDVLILIVMILLVVRGVFVGIVKDLVLLGGIILAVILARIFGPMIGSLITSWLGEQLPMLNALGYAAVFVLVFVLAAVGSRVAKSIVAHPILSIPDRVGGAALGLLVTIVVFGVTLKLFSEIFTVFGRSVDGGIFTRLCLVIADSILGM